MMTFQVNNISRAFWCSFHHVVRGAVFGFSKKKDKKRFLTMEEFVLFFALSE